MDSASDDNEDVQPDSHYKSPFQRRAKWRRRIPIRKTPRRLRHLAVVGIENCGFHHDDAQCSGEPDYDMSRETNIVRRRLDFHPEISSENICDARLSDVCCKNDGDRFKLPSQQSQQPRGEEKMEVCDVAPPSGELDNEVVIDLATSNGASTVESEGSVGVAGAAGDVFIGISIGNVAGPTSSLPICATQNDKNVLDRSIEGNRLVERDVKRSQLQQRHHRRSNSDSSSLLARIDHSSSSIYSFSGNIFNFYKQCGGENEVVVLRRIVGEKKLGEEETTTNVMMPRDRRSRDASAVDGERRSRRIKAHSWDDSILTNNLSPPLPPLPPHPNNITNNNHGVIGGGNMRGGGNNRHHRHQQRPNVNGGGAAAAAAAASSIESTASVTAAVSPVEASCSSSCFPGGRGGSISVVAVNTNNNINQPIRCNNVANTSCSGSNNNNINANNNNNNGRVLRRERKPTDPVPPIPVSCSDHVQTTCGLENVLNPELLPDILNSHLPPPYSTLPHANEHSTSVNRLSSGHTCGDTTNASSSSVLSNVIVPPLPPAPPLPPPPPPHTSNVVATAIPQPGTTTTTTATAAPPPHMRPISGGFPRPTGPSGGGGGRRRRSRGTPRGSHYTPDDEPKHCCGVAVTQTVSIRWFIVMIAFVGLCCAVVGTVLGTIKPSGREHLTVSLLMIGVGIVLITVSGIAWRLTSHDAPSCRMMLGLHSEEPEPNRRFVPRVPPSYGRPHHPYAAMMYPEFQYRPPPPSYQASMQEYRLRLLLLDRHHPTPPAAPSSLSPVSPPPTYRSNSNNTFTRPPINFSRDGEHSRPPSYRSRGSSVNPCPNSDSSTYNPNQNGMANGLGTTQLQLNHSRDPSLSLSLLSHESLFDVLPTTTNNLNNGDLYHPSLSFTSGGGGPSCSSSGHTPQTPTDAIISWEPSVLEPQPPTHQLNGGGGGNTNARPVVTAAAAPVATSSKGFPTLLKEAVSSSRSKRSKDCNTVTIVQTNDSSRVLGAANTNNNANGAHVQRLSTHGEMEVLAHL